VSEAEIPRSDERIAGLILRGCNDADTHTAHDHLNERELEMRQLGGLSALESIAVS